MNRLGANTVTVLTDEAASRLDLVRQDHAAPGHVRLVFATGQAAHQRPSFSLDRSRPIFPQGGRGESGWCSDMTSTRGAWRPAGVRFLLSGGGWPNSPAINHDCGWGLLSGSHRQASSCRPSRAEQQLLMRSKSLPCLLTSPSWPTPDGCLV